MLSLYTDEQPEQTRRIIARVAEDAMNGSVAADISHVVQKHHAVQRLLRRRTIVTPSADRLGEKIDADRVEARRGFRHVISTIEAIALLHQYQRESDREGRVIATRRDYEV